MIKQGMVRLAVLAALVCLVGVGVRAQDVTNTTDTGSQSVQPLSFGSPVSGGSLATPAPKPRPTFLGGNHGMTLYLGYSFLDTNQTEGNTFGDSCELCAGRSGAHGFGASATFWLNENVGLTADVSGNFGNSTEKGYGSRNRSRKSSQQLIPSCSGRRLPRAPAR